MAVRINDATVLQTFSDAIPGAADQMEAYLKAVARGIKDSGVPVTLRMDNLESGGFRVQKTPCLVAEPTEKRLRFYRTAHYAEPSGALLRVGWYLVGGDRADGRLGFGAATERDADVVLHIAESIHIYAVQTAMQAIVDGPSERRSGSGGFFGL